MKMMEWERKKCCADCKTSKTPLWRGGPAGPKTLCNACGIRYRKRRACTKKREDVHVVKKQRKMLGEEEQAAVCLMALSCASVFA
ncbi:hypothetical protein Fmac_006915 [Flemingia macrophylla]|uniref:GATA-type domain-containing protein n=1 Tax=Flemingia macrophylla TaxID=520843 RepID=A0ABD1NBY4_9FABA